uniref:Thiamin biosynthesis protein S n=1 Tax=Polysiphonia scopulorum TaxID=257860 RepID=A0A1Z1MIL0_9FLOR|nr:thiamin biosynthesis protein S [Polysiphonia scopulorum]ARW65682.1 thiamin biosynthesis protein S [Polysiphonia scopulorum]
MQNYLTIFINGEPFSCDSSMSLFDILIYFNVEVNSIVVEYNNSIVDKTQFNTLYFNQNDCIELISIVGGG